ncbi:MAG: glycosyltransferase family 2 protein [Methanobrevibacter sp.]|jgi:glycosyltransferase involved in cell wall biosynthesis|nr:glycosyltransferase family 2 protein [Candidatus Methanoflexus mossambicus]
MTLLSIVVPCYNEEEMIPIFYNELKAILNEKLSFYNYELIFIDDGSNDESLSKIKEIAKIDKNSYFISFSRNFGKESAIYAGLQSVKGDYIIIIDVDLQDPPSLIPKMISCLETGKYDSVGTKRSTRKGEPFFRSLFSNIFYKLINKLSKTEIVSGARDFRVFNRNMKDAILKISEYNRFSKGIFQWVGFKTKWLEYENIQRKKGDSKWSFWKLFKYSLDGITDFSTALLSISTIAGIISSILAFIFIIMIVIKTLAFGDAVAGWPSTISVILLIGGIQLFSIGILGQYLSKTFLETKNRPIYITKESNRK